jgi:hypothetical protein
MSKDYRHSTADTPIIGLDIYVYICLYINNSKNVLQKVRGQQSE